MKFLIQLFAAAAVALIILSCEEDDVPSATRDNLIVMKAQYYGYGSNPEHQIIVVTDPNGKILGTAKPTYWTDTPVKPMLLGYGGDLVNVYLTVCTDSSYFIMAFLNLQRGADFDGPRYEFQGPEISPVHMEMDNILPFERLTVSSDFYGLTIEQISDTTWLRNSHTENGRLFAQAISNGEGRYDFFDINQVTGEAVLDFSALQQRSLKASIDLGPDAGYRSFKLTGTFDANSEGWGYNLFDTWSWSQLDIYYPDVSFAKYYSSLSYSIGGVQFAENRESSTLDFNYERIGFSGIVTSADPRIFHMETSGDFDYYTASYYAGYDGLVVFNSRQYGEFSIPDFSTVEGLRTFPFASLTTAHVELRDDDGPEENGRYFKYFTSGKLHLTHNNKSASFRVNLK